MLSRLHAVDMHEVLSASHRLASSMWPNALLFKCILHCMCVSTALLCVPLQVCMGLAFWPCVPCRLLRMRGDGTAQAGAGMGPCAAL